MADDTQSPISESMTKAIENSSWIRQMFEEGNRLKAQYGAENVFDFSLGNPSVPPPSRFREVMIEVARDSQAADHRYMTNTGLEETRDFIASRARADHGDHAFTNQHVIMTCGAAGALNVFFRSIVDEGDDIILLAPYFPEYGFYVKNFGATPNIVHTDRDFQPDVEAIAAAIGPKTRAIVINSPNNPTGVVYDVARIQALGELVDRVSKERGRPLYLISDEPYRRLVYTQDDVGSVINATEHGVVCTSFSKELGLAGERIGYILLNPRFSGSERLFAACAIATRTLGFVNAPAFMQRILPRAGELQVDVALYRENRDLIYEGLKAAGYRMPEPKGAFFLFPEAPGGNDVEFCRLLRESRVLCVPGRGFGTKGHFRVSYAVRREVIEGALPHFAAAIASSQSELDVEQ